MKAGLIEKKNGHYDRIDWGNGVKSGLGLALRLKGRPSFIALAERCGITPGNVDDHFRRAQPLRPLLLKSSSVRHEGRKQHGRSMRFPQTETTRRLASEVTELNEFLATQQIEGGIHVGYRRHFNRGDLPNHNWCKGGRLFSVGENNYQTMKKEQRLQMRINGEPVVEIDIRASYLTILHALKRRPFDPASDPYDIPELRRDDLPRETTREAAKAFVTITLGHTAFHKRWPSDKVQQFREAGINLGRRFPIKEVQQVVLARLPIMRDWPQQPITCFDLMYIESEGVVGTMLELMRVYKVPSLSVHDSLIMPVLSCDLGIGILKRRYKAACGVDPYITARMLPEAEALYRSW